MSRAARAAIAAGVALVAAAGCTDVGTDPDAVVSIVAQRTDVVSVVAGDTLRDTTGLPLRLQSLARAYNGSGQQLATPSLEVLVAPIDSVVPTTPLATVVYGPDSSAYLVAAAPLNSTTSAVQVYLQFTRALRVPQRIEIVRRATAITRDASSPTEATYATSGATSTSATFAVRLTADSAGIALPVRSTLVRFTIVAPLPPTGSGIDSVRFVEGPGRDSSLVARLDTTDGTGLASRALTIYRTPRAGATAERRNVIVVRASVVPNAPSPGRDTLPALLIPVTVVDSATSTTATATSAP